jgi:ribose 1,5-bisphosphokinase PhnN
MPAASIAIVEQGDPPVWPDVDRAKLEHVTGPLAFAVLAEGMSSGLPSVAIRVDLEDGRTVVAETSLALLAGVVIAARARFPVAFAGGPLEVRDDG